MTREEIEKMDGYELDLAAIKAMGFIESQTLADLRDGMFAVRQTIGIGECVLIHARCGPQDWFPSTELADAVRFAESMRKAGKIESWRIESYHGQGWAAKAEAIAVGQLFEPAVVFSDDGNFALALSRAVLMAIQGGTK